MKRKNIHKTFLLTIWLSVLIAAAVYFLSADVDLSRFPLEVRSFIKSSGPWAPLIYIVLYSFRSLLFLPASIITILAGILFGPLFGLIFTMIGENISANLSFVVGRYFMKDFDTALENRSKFISKTFCSTRKNGFLTVLLMRLSFVPFDLVGYFSGICHIRQKEFAWGTLLGTIPGLLAYTMLGSSLGNLKFLYISGAIMLVSLLIALILRRRDLSRNLGPDLLNV